MAWAVCHFFIPRLRNQQVVSSFEFLRDRFSSSVSRLAVIIYLVQSLLYLSVTLYTPSLALSTVIDEDINIILVCLFAIATFMTVLGGMKAVLLTDVLFGAIMFFGQLSILTESFINLPEEKLDADQMRNFSKSSPSIWDIQNQYSFWDLTIGGFFMCLYLYGANQASVHRYLRVLIRQKLQSYLCGSPLLLLK